LKTDGCISSSAKFNGKYFSEEVFVITVIKDNYDLFVVKKNDCARGHGQIRNLSE